MHADLAASPLSAEDAAEVAASLPPPMIPFNYESVSEKCFIGDNFIKSIQLPCPGWEWMDDAPKVGCRLPS